MNSEILLGVGMFTVIVLSLVVLILVARSWLVSSGDVTIEINGERKITVPAGGRPWPARTSSCPRPAAAVARVPSASASSNPAAARCCPPKKPTSRGVTRPKAGAFPARPRSSRT